MTRFRVGQKVLTRAGMGVISKSSRFAGDNIYRVEFDEREEGWFFEGTISPASTLHQFIK